MSPPRAIILAAGRGERLRPLTDATPKPLLPVRGKPMIVWHLEALARAGVREVVINTAWLEDQFPRQLGDGATWGLRIHWSFEGRDHGGALETAGGIATVLDRLSPRGDEPFWVISGDIHAPDFSFDRSEWERFCTTLDSAHLWLVDNPPFHPRGDFRLDTQGRVASVAAVAATPGEPPSLTYANIALMRPALLAGAQPGQRAALGAYLHAAAAQGTLTGRRWGGEWHNVGTPQQWQALQDPPPRRH